MTSSSVLPSSPTSMSSDAIDFLTFLLNGLIEKTDSIRIEQKIDINGLTLTITCDKSEMKYLVGRNGSVANAIRKVMEMWGRKNKAKVNIYIP